MTPIMQMVELMMHSGLPCFRGRCHSRCARIGHDKMLIAGHRTWLDTPGSYRRGDAEAAAGAVPAASDREGGRRVHARPHPRVIQQLSHEPLRRVPKDAKRHPILERPCAACAIYILLLSPVHATSVGWWAKCTKFVAVRHIYKYTTMPISRSVRVAKRKLMTTRTP